VGKCGKEWGFLYMGGKKWLIYGSEATTWQM
jgi:hypothetical protein